MRLPFMRLFHLRLQLLRCQLSHARRFVGDDDLGTGLVALDEESVGCVERSEWDDEKSDEESYVVRNAEVYHSLRQDCSGNSLSTE
jgi:hypothetical protein